MFPTTIFLLIVKSVTLSQGQKLLAGILDLLVDAKIHVQRLMPYLIVTGTNFINQGT